MCFLFVWLGFSVHAAIDTEIIHISCEFHRSPKGQVCQLAPWVTCEKRIPPHRVHAFSWQRKASEMQTQPLSVVLELPEIC